MSWTSCENFNPNMPDTKVLLYNDESLDPNALKNHGLFRSVVRTSNHVLVTDTNVAKLYLDDLQTCLKGLSIHAQVYVLEPGDASKSIACWSALLEQCAGFKLDKASSVIAFGGGVVGDVAGFLASTLFRGVNFVNIPTTVLNQVDAAIDWKKGLNLPWGKNMVGCMYSPTEVWVNAAFLRTLDERQTRDGISECIKMALCLSTSYLDNLSEARIKDSEWLAAVINESAAFKTELMKRNNEHVEGVKQYGHAIGHAIEHLSKRRTGFGHGEAIAIGMCITAEMALIAGHCDQETVDRHYEAFRKHHLPTTVPDWMMSEEVWAQTTTDKHFLEGEMYTMIVTTIGSTAEDAKGRHMLPFGKDIVMQALQNNREKAI